MKGGVALSQENSSTLRFSLEESVWFQKGQEVADLLSISLDPNITIQENDQYIVIQGSLELTGEYTRNDDYDFIEEEEVFQAPKLIHSVIEREEGVCEFLHHFPVDITIPLSRVVSLNEIDVEIETFDYVMPENSCLTLTADLSIAGLLNEDIEEVEEKQDAYREAEFTSKEEEPVEIEVSSFQAVSPLIEEEYPNPLEAMNDTFSPFEVEVRKSSFDDGDDWEDPKVIPYFSEADSEDITSLKPDAEPELQVSFRSEKETFTAEEVFEKPVPESSEYKVEESMEETEMKANEEESSSSSPEEEPKKKKALFSKTKTLTFTEFFARKEEETHTKVKVCIVQQGDTLEKLSERYNVNVHTLLKENRLEVNQDVYEGQVLYIPL